MDQLQIEPSICISIPPVYQADFLLQLRHVEAERDKMEDGSSGGWTRKIRGMRNLSRRRHAMFRGCEQGTFTVQLDQLKRLGVWGMNLNKT